MLPPRIDTKAVSEQIGPYADTKATLDERSAIYKELLGFVPPRIEARHENVESQPGDRDDQRACEPEQERIGAGEDSARSPCALDGRNRRGRLLANRKRNRRPDHGHRPPPSA